MSPTTIQLAKGARIFKPYPRSRAAKTFQGAPHKKGLIYKITTMSPRKPNSARRTIAKIKLLSNNKRIFAKIPGIGDHRLQNHALVMIRGHGPKDTPGINYHLIRGLCDFHTVELHGRKNRRSKFGVKKGIN
jgi:small subunit ribosomal protein S12